MKLFLSLAVLLLLVSGVAAQQQQQQQQSTQSTPRGPAPISVGASTDIYQIGPGDVLDVRVLGHAEFTQEVNVQANGRIRVPFFEGDIDVMCKTETQVQDAVREKLLTLLRRPQVSVMVKEYRSRRASVVGAVRTPTQFTLQRRARLLDLINASGGATPTAGNFINIVTPVESDRGMSCDDPDPIKGEIPMETLDRKLVEAGDPSVNRYVRSGEFIEIPEAGKVYLTGAVNQPSAIPLTSKLTLTQALAVAGGVPYEGKKDKILIIRSGADGKSAPPIPYDLAAIQKDHNLDPMLRENDVIFIPTSGTRKVFKGLTTGVLTNPTAMRVLVP